MSRTAPSDPQIRSCRAAGRTAIALALVLALLVAIAAVTAPVAAAGPGVDDVTVSPGSVDAGAQATHVVTVSASEVSDTATVTLTFPDEFAGGSDGSIDEVTVSEVTGGTVDGDVAVSGGEATVDSDVDDGADGIDVTFEVRMTHPTVAKSHDLTVDLETGGSSTTTVETDAFETALAVEYRVGGEPQSPVALGQTVVAVGLAPSTEYNLRAGDATDSDFVRTVEAGTDGNVSIDTGEVDRTAELFVSVPGEQTPLGGTVEVVSHEMGAEFGSETVDDAGDGSTTGFSVPSNVGGAQFPLDVSTGGALDAGELFRVFTGGESPNGVARDAEPGSLDEATTTVGPSGLAVAMYDSSVENADSRIVLLGTGSASGTVDFAGTRTTTYDVDVRALDTDAEATASVSVTPTDLDGSFGQTTYESPAGDLVDISVNLGAADSGYVLIGGDRLSDPDAPAGYFDVLYVGGDASITVNTRLIGTDAPTAAVYESDTAVVSYAHEYGASTPATDTETFADLRFEDGDGDRIAGDLAAFRSAAGTGNLPGPLVPQRYRLTVGAGDAIVLRDDGVVQPARAFDRSHLILTTPELREEMDLFTTIGGSASDVESIGALRESGLEREAVTKGDRIVLGIEATGIWGALSHLSDQETVYGGESGTAPLTDLLAEPEGVTLTVRQTNPGRNERRTELDLGSASTGDAFLLFEGPEEIEGHGDGPTAGTMYLVIDTRDGTAFSEDVRPGDEFEVVVGFEGVDGDRYRYADTSGPSSPFAAESATNDRVDEQFPYWGLDDDGVRVTRTFTIQAETWEYDRITDAGELLVRPEADATITGETTLLPATEMTAEFVSDAGPTPRVAENEVDIDENGTVTIGADFSGLEPGSRVNLELYQAGELYDSRSVVVVEDVNNPFSLHIDRTTPNLTVTQGESLANLTVTVRNDGAIEGRNRLEVDVGDGALVDGRTVRVRADRERNVSFSRTTVDLDPGEYAYTAAIDGDEASGTLIVEPDPNATDDNPDGAGGLTDGSDGDDADDTNDATDGDDASDPDDRDGDDANNGSDGDEETPDDAPVTLLPFGIGTRETVGGTVLVGATYLLGHWV